MSEEIQKQFEEIKGLLTELVHLNKVALLDDGVMRFNFNGQTVHLFLPEAHLEYVQRTILRNRTFYEWRQLTQLKNSGHVKPGARILDVGGNLGNHSVFFGVVLGASMVIAVEPQDHVFDTLCRNLELNNLTTSLALKAMVGRTKGAGKIAAFNPYNYGGAKFEAAADGGTAMTTLDDLRDEHGRFDFIKIDVEGFEDEVLAGGSKVLSEDRPVLWLELLEGAPAATARIASGAALEGYRFEALSRTDFLFVPA